MDCAICGFHIWLPYPCSKAHADHCHDCWERSLRGGFDRVPHPAPREVPVPWLSRRELAAVAVYTRHLLAVTGTGPLVELVTEEDQG